MNNGFFTKGSHLSNNTMLNNNGLDALAALASTVSSAAASSTSTNSNNSSTTGPSTESSGSSGTSVSTGLPDFSHLVARAAARMSGVPSTSGSEGYTSTQQQQQDYALATMMQNAASLLQSTQNMSPQQWQQILTAAAGIGTVSSSVQTGTKAAPLNNPGPACLPAPTPMNPTKSNPSIPSIPPIPPIPTSGMTSSHTEQSNLASLQQQLALYQQIMQQQGPTAASYVPTNTSASSINSPIRAAVSACVKALPPNPQQMSLVTNTVNPATNITYAAPGTACTVPKKELREIAPYPCSTKNDFDDFDDSLCEDAHSGDLGDKQLQKRAANRRSAQLSRKRKKAFIEELKDENDELRRKEQILKSIPDLVVVFDSSGKLWFVSQSVSRMLDYTAKELEGTSFWNRLCEESVRLLKAAFMDSLAARSPNSDTAPLGSGFWELRLIDRDTSTKTVILNGVVHFAGNRPECVCTIRPRTPGSTESMNTTPKNKSHSEKHSSASSTSKIKSRIHVNAHQSVFSRSSRSVCASMKSSPNLPGVERKNAADQEISSSAVSAMRVSDSGNSSGTDSAESCQDRNPAIP